MFYADKLFSRRGALAKVWQLSYKTSALSRRDIKDTKVVESVRAIQESDIPFALRAQGQLLLGVIKIYDGKVRFVQQTAMQKLEELTITEQQRRRGVEAAITQIAATNQQITMTENQERAMIDDPLDEQRWLEQQQAALQETEADLSQHITYPSLSLSLSQADPRLSLSQSQQSIALEQTRRMSQGPAYEEAAAGGLDFDLDIPEDQLMQIDHAVADGRESLGLEMPREAQAEAGRISMASAAIDHLMDIDMGIEAAALQDTSLILTDVSIDQQQAAIDAEAIRQREQRRQQKKRLRFAVEIRDEQQELDTDTIRTALADTTDIRTNRLHTSLLNEKKQRERLVTETTSLNTLLHNPMIVHRDAETDTTIIMEDHHRRRSIQPAAPSDVDDPIAALMNELFSVEGLRNVRELEAAERESAAETTAAIQEEQDRSAAMIQEEIADIIPPDIDFGFEEAQQPPAVETTTTAAAEALQLPEEERKDAAAVLAATEQADARSAEAAHEFFHDQEQKQPDTTTGLVEDQTTGFSSRTHQVLSIIQRAYNRSNTDTVALSQLAPIKSSNRNVAAGIFYQLLVLSSQGALQCQQSTPFADINIQKGSEFDRVGQRLADTNISQSRIIPTNGVGGRRRRAVVA